jgi:hypothetical protein
VASVATTMKLKAIPMPVALRSSEPAPLAISAGADTLVAGTATFKGGPSAYAANIAALRAGPTS